MRKFLAILTLMLLPGSTLAEPWVKVPYDPANFFAQEPMTWSVPEKFVSSYHYKLLDSHTMLINFSIKQSTVGGTPTPELRLMIPGGYTAGSQVLTPITLYDRWDGRTYQQSVGTVGVSTPGINYLQIRKLDNQNWELSDSTYVIGQIIVELCADGVVCAYEK